MESDKEQANLKIKVSVDPEANSLERRFYKTHVVGMLSKNDLCRFQTRSEINNFEPEVPWHLLHQISFFTVTLDCIMNLSFFFPPDFPRFLMGILHKTACWKPFFLAEPPSSHLVSFFLAAHPRQRQWPGCSQWHSSPSRQLWTPWVGHEKKKVTKWRCQSRGKTRIFFFSLLFF